MASLLESFASMASPEALKGIARSLRVDPAVMSQGLSLAAPTLVTGLANAASTPEGLDTVMSLLPAEVTDDVVGLVETVFNTPAGRSQLRQLLDTAFAGGTATVSRTLDKATGVPVSALLPVAAPVLMNEIKKMATSQNLDADGVARMLQGEANAFMAKGGTEVDIVKEAWANVERLNKVKSHFDTKELAAIATAPMAAAGLVITSDRSWAGGISQEVAAALQTIDVAETRAGNMALIDLLPEMSQDQVETYLNSNSGDVMLGTIRSAVAAVNAKATPEQAAGYRSFLLTLADNVAKAAKEGGFLGIGAKQVTDAEAAALAQIKAAVEG